MRHTKSAGSGRRVKSPDSHRASTQGTTREPPRKRRIDIYTIDIGGGHIAPAQAIKQAFDLRGDTDLDVRVVNLGISLNATFLRFLYKFYWDKALRYPPLINAFYRGADNPFLMKIVDRMFGLTTFPKFVRYMEREKPDVVVSTYFTFTHYLEMLRRVDKLDATAVVLNPEPFDSHQIWFSPVFDWSMVFSRKSRDEIVEKGLPANRLKVFPFPIKPSFSTRTQSASVLRGRLGLEKKPFTVLFFFGAEGVGPVKKFLAALIEAGISLQAVVVCGRNERLKVDLERLGAAPQGRLTLQVRGYVTNLADYIAAADIVVGKSGPNQVFETLLQNRPLVISSFLANEKETTNWVIGNKLGWLTRSPAHLAALLARLSAHPQVLKAYQANIRAMRLRSGAPEIAEFLAGLARQKRAPRKRPVAEALRKFANRVKAEGEALGRRIEETANVKRIARSPAVRRARVPLIAISLAADRAARARASSRAHRRAS